MPMLVALVIAYKLSLSYASSQRVALVESLEADASRLADQLGEELAKEEEKMKGKKGKGKKRRVVVKRKEEEEEDDDDDDFDIALLANKKSK